MVRVPRVVYSRRQAQARTAAALSQSRDRPLEVTMDTHLPEYELYAIRYAERDTRRSDHFIGGDPHDGPMPMDYFVWVAIAPHHTVVIDTRFTAAAAPAPHRPFLPRPSQAPS